MDIYRKKSLEQLDHPDKLDSLVEVASGRAWLVLLGIVLFAVVVSCIVAVCLHIEFLPYVD